MGGHGPGRAFANRESGGEPNRFSKTGAMEDREMRPAHTVRMRRGWPDRITHRLDPFEKDGSPRNAILLVIRSILRR